MMIYLSYSYDFELQGRLGGVEKKSPPQQQLGVLLDLSAIAAGKKNLFSKLQKHIKRLTLYFKQARNGLPIFSQNSYNSGFIHLVNGNRKGLIVHDNFTFIIA